MMRFPIYGKIKNVPNHQPAHVAYNPVATPWMHILAKRYGTVQQGMRWLKPSRFRAAYASNDSGGLSNDSAMWGLVMVNSGY